MAKTKKAAEFQLANIDKRKGSWMFVPPLAELPTLAERQSLKRGDSVELVFKSNTRDEWEERAWVTVNTVLDSGRYIGRLSKRPHVMPLKRGDTIQFGAEHVAAMRVKKAKKANIYLGADEPAAVALAKHIAAGLEATIPGARVVIHRNPE